jgi:hypothetical protein
MSPFVWGAAWLTLGVRVGAVRTGGATVGAVVWVWLGWGMAGAGWPPQPATRHTGNTHAAEKRRTVRPVKSVERIT